MVDRDLASTLLRATGQFPVVTLTGPTPERDVRTISNIGDLVTFQRFVERCAGRTGQLLNYSTLTPWNRLHEYGVGR